MPTGYQPVSICRTKIYAYKNLCSASIIPHLEAEHNPLKGVFMQITQKNNIPIMLSVNDTAEMFSISKYYARKLALSGNVKAVRVGNGKILINYQSVCEYFNSTSLTGTDKIETAIIHPVPVKL